METLRRVRGQDQVDTCDFDGDEVASINHQQKYVCVYVCMMFYFINAQRQGIVFECQTSQTVTNSIRARATGSGCPKATQQTAAAH